MAPNLKKEGRTSFFEKKEAKKLCPCGPRRPQRARQSPKVFWFFFSKKNCFLTAYHQPAAAQAAAAPQ
jgi:hypothetical protein